VAPTGRMNVLQDVKVVEVSAAGRSLLVTLRTLDDRTGTVEFLHEDDLRRDANRSLLERWMTTATPVTYVNAGGNGTLVDERVLLERALPSADPLDH